MVVCGLAKQLFVSIAFMALFAMLTMNVHEGTELSRHITPLLRRSLSSDSMWACYHQGGPQSHQLLPPRP